MALAVPGMTPRSTLALGIVSTPGAGVALLLAKEDAVEAVLFAPVPETVDEGPPAELEPLAPSVPVAETDASVVVALPLAEPSVPVAEMDISVAVALPLIEPSVPVAEADPLVTLPSVPVMDSEPDDASLALPEMLEAVSVAVPVTLEAESVTVPEMLLADPVATKEKLAYILTHKSPGGVMKKGGHA